jgi:hypothetical protein
LKTENNAVFFFFWKPNEAWFFLLQVKKGESGNNRYNSFFANQRIEKAIRSSAVPFLLCLNFESAGIALLRKQEVIITNVILTLRVREGVY